MPPYHEQRAIKLLAEHGLSRPPIDVYKLAKKLGIRVVEEGLGNDVSGMLYREGDRAVILVNRNESSVRQRFSVAHELGHYILHQGSSVFVDRRVRFRDSTSSTGTNREEVQANRFAAALLMPESLVLKEVHARRQRRFLPTDEELIQELADLFDVSTHAIEFRLGNLGELGTF